MSKKNDAPKRKLFGRNIFTLVVFGGGLLLIVLAIFATVSYVSTYNGSLITPYEDKDFDEKFAETDYDFNAIRMKASEFEEFGILLSCTDYSEDSASAKFRLETFKKENTKAPNGNITANVMMTAKWINFVSYATKTTTLKMYEDEATALESNKSSFYKDFTVKNLADFPAKTSTFPVKITVEEPTIYLYISYSYIQSGETKSLAYILEYSYDELIPESGGIRK